MNLNRNILCALDSLAHSDDCHLSLSVPNSDTFLFLDSCHCIIEGIPKIYFVDDYHASALFSERH